jgi:hypothetical protein
VIPSPLACTVNVTEPGFAVAKAAIAMVLLATPLSSAAGVAFAVMPAGTPSTVNVTVPVKFFRVTDTGIEALALWATTTPALGTDNSIRGVLFSVDEVQFAASIPAKATDQRFRRAPVHCIRRLRHKG